MGELERTRGEAIEGKSRPVPPLGRPGVGEDMPDLSPVELLAAEHDLIRRVVRVLERESGRVGEEHIHPLFLATIVDFLYTYAGRVHHGKEEILFRELDDENPSAEHRRTMEELAREHVEMRHAVAELRQANDRYQEGEEEALDDIRDGIDTLTDLYPDHMETEDEVFFPTAIEYLDDKERRTILEDMRGHDQAMVHEKYDAVAEQLEGVTEDWAVRE